MERILAAKYPLLNIESSRSNKVVTGDGAELCRIRADAGKESLKLFWKTELVKELGIVDTASIRKAFSDQTNGSVGEGWEECI